MVLGLLAGIIIGVVLAIPPGPVALTAMRVSLTKGARQGSLVGLGTGFMDFVYCALAIFTAGAENLMTTRSNGPRWSWSGRGSIWKSAYAVTNL